MIDRRNCRFCKYFGLKFKENGGIEWIGCKCEKINSPLTPAEASSEFGCGMFEEDMEFKNRDDVAIFVMDMKCSGCEYAAYDEKGNAYPSDDCWGGCNGDLDEFWEDYKKLPLEKLINRYTWGNDKVLSLYNCGNFGDYFKGYKLVKKGDVRSFIKE